MKGLGKHWGYIAVVELTQVGRTYPTCMERVGKEYGAY